ncbi:hypothetical protein DEU35_2667 [Microbacterium sp. AG157]|nr:hypothetical protein DEU35_2667 [Microbacterium sp. AG157]
MRRDRGATSADARSTGPLAYDGGMPRPRRRIEEEVVIVRSLVWFALGIVGGFVAAHLVNKDPRGQEVLAQLDSRIGEFTDRMSDAYHAQETRLSEIIDDAKSVASSAAEKTTDVVDDAASAAKKAVSSSD